MKKVALVLALLLFSVPAWAGITISAVQPVAEVNEILITYEVDGGDANVPRAFALDITVDGTNSVISNPYDIHSEFYVYPGSIVISGGQVTNPGTPVASKTNTHMIIEMGSLYAANDPCHTSPPLSSGTLLKFTVASDDPNVDVCPAGNAPRGTVVMEDPDITFNDLGYVTYVCVDAILGPVGCATCGGDADGNGDVDLNDYYALQGNLMFAQYLTGAYLITADHANPTVAGLWVDCMDKDGNEVIDLNDYYAVQGNLMFAQYLDGAYLYHCGDPRFP